MRILRLPISGVLSGTDGSLYQRSSDVTIEPDNWCTTIGAQLVYNWYICIIVFIADIKTQHDKDRLVSYIRYIT